MPSFAHEALLLLFRNRLQLAPELLQRVYGHVPQYNEIRADSADLSDLRPQNIAPIWWRFSCRTRGPHWGSSWSFS